MSRITYKKLLQSGNWIGYSYEIANKFNCILTSCLISFFLKKESDLELEGDWFYVTQEEVEKKLFIGEKPFFKMRNLLVNIGVFEIKYEGIPRRCYYRIPDDFIDKINDFDFLGTSNSQMEELKKYSPISPNGRSQQLPNGGAVNSQMEEHSINKESNIKNLIIKESNIPENLKFSKKNIKTHNNEECLSEFEKGRATYIPKAEILNKEKNSAKKEVLDDLKALILEDDIVVGKSNKFPVIPNKLSKTESKPFLREDGKWYSVNDKGVELQWYGFEDTLNVCLSLDEKIKLHEKFNEKDKFYRHYIESLSRYKLDNPSWAKKRSSDYRTLINWIERDNKKAILNNNNKEEESLAEKLRGKLREKLINNIK